MGGAVNNVATGKINCEQAAGLEGAFWGQAGQKRPWLVIFQAGQEMRQAGAQHHRGGSEEHGGRSNRGLTIRHGWFDLLAQNMYERQPLSVITSKPNGKISSGKGNLVNVNFGSFWSISISIFPGIQEKLTEHTMFLFGVVLLLALHIPYKNSVHEWSVIFLNWLQPLQRKQVCCQNNISISSCFFQKHDLPAYVVRSQNKLISPFFSSLL